MPEEKGVLLCVMPFLPIERPALGVSLLKSHLTRRGIACDVRYFNHRFADEISFGLYQQVAQLTPTHDLVGEWIFTRALLGEAARGDEAFARLARRSVGHFYDEALIGQIRHARALAERFMAGLAAEIDTSAYQIVGFSTTFQQNIASLALARRLKERDPSLVIVFGGANCEGEMGLGLHRAFSFIDVVCSGEADESFPRVVEAVLAGRSLTGIPGIIYREGNRTVHSTGEQAPINQLDALPYPDHADFLAAFRRSTASLFAEPELTVETSRGCWWGQKHHCTFCGLNGLSMRYRSKSSDRAIAEIRELRDRYGITTFFCTDNILDTSYFNTVFPALAQDRTSLQLFYEMKANLKKDQLRVLHDLGTTWLQPGIESLNTHVLQLMRKGIRGIRNVQTLKWAKEFGFVLTWNILCGFPGERPEDYVELIRFMRLIPHLPPPSSFAAFRLDRFSPMFNDPAAFGLTNIRPYPSYELCYPLDHDQLARVAYFFTYSGATTPETLAAINEAWEVGQWWKQNHRKSHLVGRVTPELLLIEDARAGRQPRQMLLFGRERLVYLAADEVQSAGSATYQLREQYPHLPWHEHEVRTILEQFVEEGLVLKEEDLYLSLAVLSPLEETADQATSWQQPARAPSSWLRQRRDLARAET